MSIIEPLGIVVPLLTEPIELSLADALRRATQNIMTAPDMTDQQRRLFLALLDHSPTSQGQHNISERRSGLLDIHPSRPEEYNDGFCSGSEQVLATIVYGRECEYLRSSPRLEGSDDLNVETDRKSVLGGRITAGGILGMRGRE